MISRRATFAASCYVEYEPDWPLRDREDRFWAYVYRAPDGLFVNLELIRLGYARLSAPEPFEHQKLLRAYELWARKNQKGLWNPDASKPAQGQPTTTRAAEQTLKPPASQPATDDVIVYVTEQGHKYHRKECQFVRNGATAITLREAKDKGYTPCSRCKPPE